MERLKRHGINCLQPKRIMISGKIRVFCFDKTGTLTKEGLDFVGFQAPVSFFLFSFCGAWRKTKRRARNRASFFPETRKIRSVHLGPKLTLFGSRVRAASDARGGRL